MKAALLLLALPLAGCADLMPSGGSGPRVVGTGKPVVEARKAQEAKGAEFSGALEATIRKGAPKLEIEAQKEILPHIKSEFKDGRLHVWTEGNLTGDGPWRVRYTTPSPSNVEASGACKIDAEGLGGDSKVVLSGASKLKATGKVGRLDVEASGASEADLSRLQARNAHAEASGASKVRLWATQTVDASASGASEIRHRMPVSGPIKAEASGASTVKPEG